ncbi:hypothetical protein ACFVWR_05805 [Leifsonia sp. NPDC058292]|uniref:hypothetical protein n=1 Tax=Leifsonia sp. NPDC058292 TaxID=3346428 RepID=UPI0036DEABC3
MDSSGDQDDAAVVRIRTLLLDAVERLTGSGARDEALAQFIPRHRKLLITREAVLQPAGRAWRLGVLLLAGDGRLFATGSITRALEPGRPAYQSQSAEDRRAFRAAAMRGHFEPGETVNHGFEPIALDAESLRASDGPLMLRDGMAVVRWSPSTEGTVELATYLAERVDLLAHPPQGA